MPEASSGANRYHPSATPVGLIGQCLGNSPKAGDLVYEPFAGSGSTIIAGEGLGRPRLDPTV